MKYSDIIKLFYEATGTNASSMAPATLNVYTQPAEDRVVSLILQSDGRFQWDDTNSTDFPIATFTLVSGQQDYAFATNYIKILGVSVKDKGGIWHKLLPFDPDDLNGGENPQGISGPLFGYGPQFDRAEFLKSSGLPQYYDVLGQSAVMYPAPDNGVSVTLAAGGKFYFQRTGKHFDWTLSTFDDGTGTTASVPGFNSLYHSLIPLWAAYNYNLLNNPSLCANIMNEILRLEAQLKLDYSKRDKDERTIMTQKKILYV